MLLLELGAELNSKDDKNFTAVAHAEATDHFDLMDRFVHIALSSTHTGGVPGQAGRQAKLQRARSRLDRCRISQLKPHLKALAEIYTVNYILS